MRREYVAFAALFVIGIVAGYLFFGGARARTVNVAGFGGINPPIRIPPSYVPSEQNIVGYGGINPQPIRPLTYTLDEQNILGYGGINPQGGQGPPRRSDYVYVSQAYTKAILAGVSSFYAANAAIEDVVMTESLGGGSPNLEAFWSAVKSFGDSASAFSDCSAYATQLIGLDPDRASSYQQQIATCNALAQQAREIQSTVLNSLSAVKGMSWQESIWNPDAPEAKITGQNIGALNRIAELMQRHVGAVQGT